MRETSTDLFHPQGHEFDFPCSASFRQFFSDPEERQRRHRRLPHIGSDERAFLWRQYIHDVEAENFRLRVALDQARLALGRRAHLVRAGSAAQPAQPVAFSGIGDEERAR